MRPGKKRRGQSREDQNVVPGRGFCKCKGLEVGSRGWKSSEETKSKSPVSGSHVFSTWRCFCLDVSCLYVLLIY